MHIYKEQIFFQYFQLQFFSKMMDDYALFTLDIESSKQLNTLAFKCEWKYRGQITIFPIFIGNISEEFDKCLEQAIPIKLNTDETLRGVKEIFEIKKAKENDIAREYCHKIGLAYIERDGCIEYDKGYVGYANVDDISRTCNCIPENPTLPDDCECTRNLKLLKLDEIFGDYMERLRELDRAFGYYESEINNLECKKMHVNYTIGLMVPDAAENA
ncbi:hypothetical protein BX667DRAFT_493369 [Coemansia mojavensis]|nr:hypothetical protein BX667DRAFT_493369 [Coemansia mojavensis]